MKNDAYGEFVTKEQKTFQARERAMKLTFKVIGFCALVVGVISNNTTLYFSNDANADLTLDSASFYFNLCIAIVSFFYLAKKMY